MTASQSVPLLAATMTTGLSAGLLTGFAVAVMPGLAEANDNTFISTMAHIEDRILNPAFFTVLLGALAASAVTVATHVGRAPRDVQAWTVAGLGLYLGVVAVTRAVHLPLNAQVDAGRGGDAVQLTALRRAVEGRWVRWHRVRTLLAVGAFASLVLAVDATSRGSGSP